MDRMLVVVFGNETNAYASKKALLQLDDEGSIGLSERVFVASSQP